ncbi:MAG TPA: substrate-binding domain-containing protein [Chthoniobacteraceae bacterium]|nr:substrate-binding domain-containing protein [Chthoniobacteraceae bacterium]
MASKTEIVRAEILKAIRSRRIEAGQKIPSEREFASLLGINHRTVRRALQELVTEGEIEKRPRVGNFLKDLSRPVQLAVAIPSYFLSENGQHLITGLILEGLNAAIDHRSYSLTTLPYRPDHFMEDIGHLLQARKVRGLFLIGNWQIPPAAVKKLMESGVRIVLLTRHPALIALGLPSIHSDHTPAISTIIRGLIDRGHRKLALIRYSHPGLPEVRLLLEEICRVHQLGDPEDLTITLPNSQGSVDFGPLKAAMEAATRPTAIIVPDEIAAGMVFREAYRLNLKIPDDLSLAAYSDLTPGAHPVPLSAPDSAPNVRKRATMAAEHIIALLQGVPVAESHISMTPNVHWRESVGSPPSPAATDLSGKTDHRQISLQNGSKSGFGILELVVTMMVLSILAVFLLQAFKHVKARSQLSVSSYNQRQIVLGLISYANEHQGELPQIAAKDSPINPGDNVFWTRTLAYYRYVPHGGVFFSPRSRWGQSHANLYNPKKNSTKPWAYPSYGANGYGAMTNKSETPYKDHPANLFRIGENAAGLMLLRDIHHPAYAEEDHGWYWWGGGDSRSYIPPDDGGYLGMMSAAFADGHVEVYRISEFRKMITDSNWSEAPEYNRVYTRD